MAIERYWPTEARGVAAGISGSTIQRLGEHGAEAGEHALIGGWHARGERVDLLGDVTQESAAVVVLDDDVDPSAVERLAVFASGRVDRVGADADHVRHRIAQGLRRGHSRVVHGLDHRLVLRLGVGAARRPHDRRFELDELLSKGGMVAAT